MASTTRWSPENRAPFHEIEGLLKAFRRGSRRRQRRSMHWCGRRCAASLDRTAAGRRRFSTSSRATCRQPAERSASGDGTSSASHFTRLPAVGIVRKFQVPSVFPYDRGRRMCKVRATPGRGNPDQEGERRAGCRRDRQAAGHRTARPPAGPACRQPLAWPEAMAGTGHGAGNRPAARFSSTSQPPG